MIAMRGSTLIAEAFGYARAMSEKYKQGVECARARMCELRCMLCTALLHVPVEDRSAVICRSPTCYVYTIRDNTLSATLPRVRTITALPARCARYSP